MRALTNTSGTVTDARSTDAFGLVVTSSGSTPTPFGFVGSHGYQQDSETGLMRLGHRMYDASTGRFISRDPIQAGYNWYGYANNDPVQNIDPEGLDIVVRDPTGKNKDLKDMLEGELEKLKKSKLWQKIAIDKYGDGKNNLEIIIDPGFDPGRGATGYKGKGIGVIIINPIVLDWEFWYDKPGVWAKSPGWKVIAHEIGHIDANLPDKWWRDPKMVLKEEQKTVDYYENGISLEIGNNYKRGDYTKVRPGR